MKRYLLLIIFAGFSSVAVGDHKPLVIPKITYTITVSSAAQARMIAEKRTIEAEIYYDAQIRGGGLLTPLRRAQLDFPASGGTKTFPSVDFRAVLNDLRVRHGLLAKFSGVELLNVFNSYVRDQPNLIDCEVTPPGLYRGDPRLKADEITVRARCKLIGEH